MAKWYLRLSPNGKTVFWLSVLGLFGFLVQLPLFFFVKEDGYQLGAYPVGWLFGSLASIVAYLTIGFMSKALTSTTGKGGGVSLSLLTALVRGVLYFVVLLVSALATFRPEWIGGFHYFDFFTCFGAIIPMPIITLFVHAIEIKKETALLEEGKEEQPAEEAKADGEKGE